jgi:DNA-binding NarL/FixJ family response regulator
MHEHPVLAHIVQTDDDQAMRISNFWSQRQLHGKGLYTDFYRCVDVEDALCIRLSSMLPRVVGIAWHRDRSFTERECLTANLIRPHVDQAWQNARIVSQMHSQLQLLESCLEGAAAAMILCDAQGRVQFITALARKYLVEYLGASHALDHQLPQQLLAWMRHQNEQFKKNDMPPVRLPLTVQKLGRRLTIRLSSNAEASLLFMEETASVANTAVLMASCLSRRESEVLGWVAQGKTNSEVAAALRTSLSTVKKHMEHILQKLGVETRTAAAALALRSLTRAD